ncbi:MAG: 1-acyl-sn-glycerol-3-phosphate acyltransferase [Endomicrobia bacterium]|nr:1-acyl-sn-glycerol-3-phosphate acyltransferase [Endomicrobiia bacterium]
MGMTRMWNFNMQKEKSTFLFLLGRQFFRIMFALFYRREISGAENIPQNSGAIIAPNHISWLDPPLTGAAMKRPLYFMAKKELFDIPVFGWAISQTNAFPVKRGVQDMAAMRNAFSLLESGKLLLMFPEGTRSKDGHIGKARAGAGMVACNARVPLVPVKIENTDKMLKFKKIKIKFGKPIYPPENFTKNDYTELSQKALDAIAAM